MPSLRPSTSSCHLPSLSIFTIRGCNPPQMILPALPRCFGYCQRGRVIAWSLGQTGLGRFSTSSDMQAWSPLPFRDIGAVRVGPRRSNQKDCIGRWKCKSVMHPILIQYLKGPIHALAVGLRIEALQETGLAQGWQLQGYRNACSTWFVKLCWLKNNNTSDKRYKLFNSSHKVCGFLFAWGAPNLVPRYQAKVSRHWAHSRIHRN